MGAIQMENEILEILERDSRTTAARIAEMLGISEEEVVETIKRLEEKKIILGYKTLINWEKTSKEMVNAIIELKITPARGEGFDKVASRIYKYPQVKNLYLMSGSYDLCVIVQGKSMKEVALFVAEKLAPMESVISTATHFMLKTYKEEGVIFDETEKDTREMIRL